jgi:hypothetical protein
VFGTENDKPDQHFWRKCKTYAGKAGLNPDAWNQAPAEFQGIAKRRLCGGSLRFRVDRATSNRSIARPIQNQTPAHFADYQEDKYMLLGMAIKYAGLRGKEVRVIGKNRSTLAEENRIQ